jgi:hypothetical protein
MFRLSLLSALVAMLSLPMSTAGGDQPLTVRALINDATVEGPIVRGTMRLTVVNGAAYTAKGVSLRLVSPVSGTLGSGPIDVGDVENDATVVVTVQFSLEKTFMDSSDPLTMEVAYKDADGASVKATLQVARDGGAR